MLEYSRVYTSACFQVTHMLSHINHCPSGVYYTTVGAFTLYGYNRIIRCNYTSYILLVCDAYVLNANRLVSYRL